MEQIELSEVAQVFIKQLESKLTRIAMCADAGISTYDLENDAKKISAKIKNLTSLTSGLTIYRHDGSNKQWRGHSELTDSDLAKYATLCKRCGKEALEIHKFEDLVYVEIQDGLFVKLVELPDIPVPMFRVKLEGDVLNAVRTDMLAKLPESTRQLLK